MLFGTKLDSAGWPFLETPIELMWQFDLKTLSWSPLNLKYANSSFNGNTKSFNSDEITGPMPFAVNNTFGIDPEHPASVYSIGVISDTTISAFYAGEKMFDNLVRPVNVTNFNNFQPSSICPGMDYSSGYFTTGQSDTPFQNYIQWCNYPRSYELELSSDMTSTAVEFSSIYPGLPLSASRSDYLKAR